MLTTTRAVTASRRRGHAQTTGWFDFTVHCMSIGPITRTLVLTLESVELSTIESTKSTATYKNFVNGVREQLFGLGSCIAVSAVHLVPWQ